MEIAQFQELLWKLSNETNNELREEIEKTYFEYRSVDPADEFVDNIIESILLNNELSDFACVLLRQDIDKNGQNACMYRLANVAKGSQYIDALLQLVATNKSDKILLVVAQWSCELLEKNIEVSNVFGFIQQAYANEQVRSLSVKLVAEMVNQHLDEIKKWPFDVYQFLQQTIEDTNNEVALYSIQAIAKILMDNSPQTGLAHDVVCEQTELVMQRIGATLTEGDEKNGVKMLSSLEDLVAIIGDQILDIIPQIMHLLTEIMQSSFSDEMKCQAVRIFIDITENIVNVRKFLADIITRFLRDEILPHTSQVDEQAIRVWVEEEDDIEYRADSLQAMCENCFESASYKLGKQIVLPLLLQALELANKRPENWHELLCCLNAICFAAEGLRDVIKQREVDEFSVAILANHTHQNPRVRYSVLECIGQLSTDFEPQMQKNHAEIVPCMMRLVQDPCSRVAFHSVAAMINFNSGLDYDETYKYLTQFEQVMKFAWDSGKMEGETNALTLLASLCEILDKEDLTNILRDIMPEILQQFQVTMDAIRNVQDFTRRQEEFVSAIIQAISMSVEVVPELFAGISDQIMSSLILIVERCYEQEENDQFEEAFSAIERVSETVSEDNMQGYIEQLYPIIYKIIVSKIVKVDNSAATEGNIHFSDHLLNLQSAVFLSLVSFLDRYPHAFAAYFDELTTAILNFNSLAMPELDVARLECLAEFVEVAYKCGKDVASYHLQLFPLFMKEIVPVDDQSVVVHFSLDDVQNCMDACATYIEGYMNYVNESNDRTAYTATVEQFLRSLQYLRNKARELFEEEMQDLLDTDEFDEEELDAEQQNTLESYSEAIQALGYCYTAFILNSEDPTLIEEQIFPIISEFVQMGVASPNVLYTTEAFGLCSDLLNTKHFQIGDQMFAEMATIALECLNAKSDDWILAEEIYYFFSLYLEKFNQCPILLQEQVIDMAFKMLQITTEDGSDDALTCRDNVCSFLLFAGDLTDEEDEFWENWAVFASKMTHDGEEVETVLLRVVQNIINGKWAPKLQIFVPLFATLMFSKFYSDIKNSKEEESALLMEQAKELFSNADVQSIVEGIIGGAEPGSPLPKNFENFLQ